MIDWKGQADSAGAPAFTQNANFIYKTRTTKYWHVSFTQHIFTRGQIGQLWAGAPPLMQFIQHYLYVWKYASSTKCM